MKEKYQVLIIGGGTAGIMAASQLARESPEITVGLIEPSDTHYYQPAWTLVAANTYDFKQTARPMSSLIPDSVDWIKSFATAFDPHNNRVNCKDGSSYQYDYLIVCPGLVMDSAQVDGLSEALDNGTVCSIYTDPEYVWKSMEAFKGGTAVFTQPDTPIKCGGAPQKIMYLSAEAFRKKGTFKNTNIVFATPGTVIFGIPQIRETLMKVVNRHDIMLSFGYRLRAVDSREKIAWYEMADHESYHNVNKDIKIIEDGSLKGIRFDFMHLAPPQAAPEFIRNSDLVNDAGWVELDKHSLQHLRFKNIFGLGDVAALPTAKTGAAIRKQVPVALDNIRSLMKNNTLADVSYDGYSSCPLVTSYGKMTLAEFDYDNRFTPDPKLKQMLVFDSSKEHWRLWILKKYILPYLYWNKMMKGLKV